MVIHGQNGLLVPVANPVAMAEAVCNLLNHCESRIQMGDAGRQRAKKNYSAQSMVGKMERNRWLDGREGGRRGGWMGGKGGGGVVG